MKHKWTSEDGLPIEGTFAHRLLSDGRPNVELVEPVRFNSDDYNLRLKVGDIFYRYPLAPYGEYDESEIYRVCLAQNGVAYLSRFANGTGSVFADETWFRGRTITGKYRPWGYTTVARYTVPAKPGGAITRIHEWALQYARF